MHVFAVFGAGPYLYKLYHYYQYYETQVAVIYVSGIISSAVFFPAKDIITSRLGRRKTAVLFCGLYALSCALSLARRSYVILILGRCIAGLTNSILFSTLESWCVHEHLHTYDFPKEWLPITFSHVAFGSSIVAVLAGLLADFFARWLSLGPMSPFVLAIPVFLASMGCLLALWTENFGERKEISQKEVRKSCTEGLRTIARDVDLFLIGAIQSLFETVVFVFVFIWTPSLRLHYDIDTPLGVAFASFMVCFLMGGLICDHLIARVGYTMTRLLLIITGSASGLFVLAAYLATQTTPGFSLFGMLLCLQGFELLCGFYFPIMRVLREKYLPEEHRLSITNWFRVPLTAISSLALLLLHDSGRGSGISQTFLFCAVMMALAFACSFRFAGHVTTEAGEESESSRNPA